MLPALGYEVNVSTHSASTKINLVGLIINNLYIRLRLMSLFKRWFVH